jgi:hypothetical protein
MIVAGMVVLLRRRRAAGVAPGRAVTHFVGEGYFLALVYDRFTEGVASSRAKRSADELACAFNNKLAGGPIRAVLTCATCRAPIRFLRIYALASCTFMAAKKRRAGSSRNPRVTSTESIGRAKPKASAGPGREASTNVVPAGVTEAIAAVRKTLQAAGFGAVEEYLLQEFRSFRHDQANLENKTLRFRAQLDLLDEELRDSPDLRAEFERHALMQNYLPIREKGRTRDIVAEEIAREVPLRWGDRKKPPYKDQPWAWLKRPDLFILHVYDKWYSKKSLCLRHLRQDFDLYASYQTTIRRHPERDLKLLRDTAESSDDVKVSPASRPGRV